ncbi:MAG: serine/threonine-protein kinase [Streptosporangiaceae bacterium]
MTGPPMVGDEFAGYRLRSVLGRGGMSVVYQAENPRLGSVIALKVLAPELAHDDVFRARFLEESRIAASLNHPNVIPIYDMGSSNGLLYIAMRYVSGTDMRQMIKKRGRILPSTAVFLTGQAARALDAAHRKGLVHRDVKPGNLLVERGGDDDDPDHVYLADFGITKHAMSRSGLTSTGQFVGTIDYVAPEQIRGTSVLGSADQYSLGCVLYECLTGRVPFEKDLDAAIIWAHVEETPTMPTVLRPELPPEVDEVFGRVLAKRPGDRYASCRDFVEAARAALGFAPGFVAGASAGYTPPWSHGAGPEAGYATPAPPAAAVTPPPEAFSWDRFASRAHQAGPGAEPAGSAAEAAGPVAAAAGPSARQGTLASHRRQEPAGLPSGPPPGPHAGSPPPPAGPPASRSRRKLIPWIAALAALVLIGAGVGTWAALSNGSGSHAAAMASMSAKAKAKPKTSALMNALMTTNKSADAAGKLPPSTCKQQGTAMVTCNAPFTGISAVVFQTYPSPGALYNAYIAKVNTLAGSSAFRQNFNDCGLQQTNGEVSWNHNFQHPKTYTVDEMVKGMVQDEQAAGRVYCDFTGGQQYFVWTQNDGHLMGVVAGPVHEDVWNWWVDVHHNIGLGGSMPMNM